MDAVHLDSRRLIVTDRRHTQAAPIYAETYARLGAEVEPLARAGQVVVMGGFLGSTEDGVTTTWGAAAPTSRRPSWARASGR